MVEYVEIKCAKCGKLDIRARFDGSRVIWYCDSCDYVGPRPKEEFTRPLVVEPAGPEPSVVYFENSMYSKLIYYAIISAATLGVSAFLMIIFGG